MARSERPLRVGLDLLSERGNRGGIHTYANELLRHLRKLAGVDELELITFAHADYRFTIDVEELGISVVRSPFGGLPAVARRVAQHAAVPRLIRRHKLDVVHCVNNVLPSGTSGRGVVTVLDLSAFAVPERFSRRKRAYLASQLPASVRRAAHVLCISESTREQLLTWVPDVDPTRVTVTPLAASPMFHDAADRVTEDDALRARLRLPDRFFFHVSLVEPGKNLALVVEALAILTTRGVNAPLIVAGRETSHARELERLAASRGVASQLRFLGAVDDRDLPGLYRLARGFVYPSVHEGFGLPLIEAFSCGTPAITSTRSSLPEVAGRAALLVRPEDADGMADALARLWRDDTLHALLRSRGTRRSAEFDWTLTAQGTLDAYRQVAAECSGARAPAQEAVLA